MKKSRLFRASVLLLVISLMLSLANTTFSWFSRPESLTGNSLNLSDKYAASVNNGAISFETKELNQTTGEYSIPINGVTVGFSNSVGLGAGERKCYRTDIVNTGADPQSVSLYLQSLTKGNNCDGLAIGVNGPSKTFKYLSSSGTTGNDYLEATSNLTVNNAGENSVNDVPVATNMVVEGATTNSRGETVNGVTSVYWYIKNDSTVNGMTYTIPEIYVTL